MIFYKTSSFGNDFIEIDEAELANAAIDKGGLAREICDRQRGVGADGAVFYRAGGKRFHFAVYNRDGGEAELSGNGLAGLAAVLFQRRLATSPLTLQTGIGSRRVDLLGRQGAAFRLNVEIGVPDFANRAFFPFLKDKQDVYEIDGLDFHPLAVGNPHAVVILPEDLGPDRLKILGEKLESHSLFPQRANVEFVLFTDAENPPAGTAAFRPASCRVFFYERGVGPTLASSTGSAAVFAVLRRLGLVGDRLQIKCGNEKIGVYWKSAIFIENFTRLVSRGNYFLRKL